MASSAAPAVRGSWRSILGRDPGSAALRSAALAGLVLLGACGDFTLFGEEYLPYVDLQVSPLDAQACQTQTVDVDASGSLDPLGQALAFVWALTVPAGSQATLADPSAAKTSFSPDRPGAYLVTVMAVSERGEYATSQATVTVSSDPIAKATADATQVTKGATVTLDGSGSMNPDPSCTSAGLAFAWAFQESGDKPSGSTATITPADGAQPTFRADLAGSYRATLTVTRSGQAAPASEASVTVTASEPDLNIGDLEPGDYGMTVDSVTDTVFDAVVDLPDLLDGAALSDPLALPDPVTQSSPVESPLPLTTDTQDLGTLALSLAWASAEDPRYTVTGSADLSLDLSSVVPGLVCGAEATVTGGTLTPTSETTAALSLTLSDVAITAASPAECTTLCVACDFEGTISFILEGEYRLP